MSETRSTSARERWANRVAQSVANEEAPSKDDMPAALAGFEHIKRFWHPPIKRWLAKVLPGQYYVSKRDEGVATTLGSCVTACVRDPVLLVGGINHFMLPDDGAQDLTPGSGAARYGNNAMEMLINEVLRHGGQRSRLEIKVFGGGRVMKGVSDVGQRNIDFIYRYLAFEGYGISAEDVGSVHARKLIYFPRTGKVLLKRLKSQLDAEEIQREEAAYQDRIAEKPVAGEIDLF